MKLLSQSLKLLRLRNVIAKIKFAIVLFRKMEIFNYLKMSYRRVKQAKVWCLGENVYSTQGVRLVILGLFGALVSFLK